MEVINLLDWAIKGGMTTVAVLIAYFLYKDNKAKETAINTMGNEMIQYQKQQIATLTEEKNKLQENHNQMLKELTATMIENTSSLKKMNEGISKVSRKLSINE